MFCIQLKRERTRNKHGIKTGRKEKITIFVHVYDNDKNNKNRNNFDIKNTNKKHTTRTRNHWEIML